MQVQGREGWEPGLPACWRGWIIRASRGSAAAHPDAAAVVSAPAAELRRETQRTRGRGRRSACAIQLNFAGAQPSTRVAVHSTLLEAQARMYTPD